MTNKKQTKGLSLDELKDPKNHGKPLWVVFGIADCWPQIICAELLAYSSNHGLLPIGHPGHHVVIWGASRWKRKHAFRTLGIEVGEWCSKHKFGPFFFDVQQDALDYLCKITKAPKSRD